MGDQLTPAESHDPRVDAALADYLERLDRREPLDAESFVAQHPEIADELRSLIDAELELRKLAPGGGLSDPPGSTKSFALHGQETIAPQVPAKRTGESEQRQLKEQFGRYRIVRILGQGAMGTVYLAEDTQLRRQVALKTPHFDKDPSGELLERLYREARAAATLRHPNICPVHDVGQIDGTHYISMAYIEGHPLSAFIRSTKPQPERQILIIVRKLAQALQEAHDHKIVHRDLKPANIMVDKRGEPLIMDFGLARHARTDEDVRLTHSGTLVGTPAYMAPEQVDADPAKIGPATDQYSLGVILYELLTGRLPFRGSMMAVLGQIVTKQAPAPSQIRTGLDPRIDAACLKMMAKNPSDRFPSLSAVANELATILKNPAARSAPTGQSAAGLQLPSPDEAPHASQAGASQILTSQTKKTLTATDLDSLEELARKCWNRRDYEQVIQIAERIPEKKRTAALQRLLENARDKSDEISYLLAEIDEAVRLEDGPTALKKAEALLKIKPRHRRALEIQEQFSGSGQGGAVRIGRRFTNVWREGGWVPWSALAFGFAIFATVAGVIIWWVNGTAIVINANDPNIRVEFQGQQAFLTVPGKRKIGIEPGDGEFTLNYEGLETVTKRFSIKPRETKILDVSIADNKIVAAFEGEVVPPASSGAKAKNVGEKPVESQPSSPTTKVGAPIAATHPPQSGDGFVPLFNGRDLDGWVRDPSQPGDWRVKDGILSGGGPAGPSTLYSKRADYRDFHLRAEARLSGDASSGLCFRTEMPGAESPIREPTTGFEVELAERQDRGAARTGSVYGLGSGLEGQTHTGFKSTRPIIQQGEWFTVDVFAEGLHTLVMINGQTTLDNHWVKKDFRVGRIAIQQHLGKPSAEFRKIEIKELRPDRGQSASSTIQTPNAAPSADNEYKPLFNGTDLTGWKTHSSQPGHWRVENGILIGSGAGISHLYSNRSDFKDFDLRVEARINAGGNSGVIFRSRFGPAWPANHPTFPLGYEAQIDSTSHAAKTGSLFAITGGPRSGSAVVSIPDSPVPAGQWFTLEIIARGTQIAIKVDGVVTAAYSDAGFKSGHISLQQHDANTVVEFRKIEIKELSAPSAAEAPASAPAGFVPLFNGHDLTGWKTHPKQPGNWRVENGILVGSGPGATSHLYTERGDYKDFHLRIEARINDGGNSGVYYRSRFGPTYPARQPRWLVGYNAKLDNNRLGAFLLDDGAPKGPLMIRTRVPQPPAGRWVVLEVIVRGHHIVIKTDGEVTADYTDKKRHFASGYIALQQHTERTRVEFRKIEIEEFAASKETVDNSSHSGASAPKETNLLVNGSFENGPSPGDFQSYDPGSTAIPGWTVTRGQIDLLGLNRSADGRNSVDLHGSPGYGGIKQKFKTTKGRRYRATFDLAINPEATHLIKKMGVSAASTTVVFTTDAQSKWWDQLHWTTETFDFTATANVTTLEFYTLDHSDPVAGPLIDNVRVIELAEQQNALRTTIQGD